MTDRDTYYVFQPAFPKLEILRKFITKGQWDAALKYFKAENLDPNAYIKGVRQGTWVPLLYQCLQDPRLTPFTKLLLNRGGDPLRKPDAEEYTPLIFICDELYLDFLVKKGLTVRPETKIIDVYHCFLYAKYARVKKLVRLGLLTPADILLMEQTYPDVQVEMLNTGIKYLTYYYGAQIKKATLAGTTEGPLNLKKTTEEIIARYARIMDYLKGPPSTTVLDLCVKYYLYEILTLYKARGFVIDGKPNYGLGGATEALLRPLLNDHRYEQTCFTLNVSPDPCIYEAVKCF
jgi:hypothetical protein